MILFPAKDNVKFGVSTLPSSSQLVFFWHATMLFHTRCPWPVENTYGFWGQVGHKSMNFNSVLHHNSITMTHNNDTSNISCLWSNQYFYWFWGQMSSQIWTSQIWSFDIQQCSFTRAAHDPRKTHKHFEVERSKLEFEYASFAHNFHPLTYTMIPHRSKGRGNSF